MSDNILKSTQFTQDVDMTGNLDLTGSESISENLSVDSTATIRHLRVTDTISIPGIAATSITFDNTGLAYITHSNVQSAIADVHNSMSPLTHKHDSRYSLISHTHTAGSFTITPHGNMTATTLQGALNYLEDYKSQTTHNHNGVYALVGHNHDGIYSIVGHLHTGYSLIGHNHDGVYSLIGHNHDGVYSLIGHNHDAVYASIAHNHNASQITYDPSISTLISINVQDAIDEIDNSIETLNSEDIVYDSTANDLQANNIEDAIDEIIERYDVVFHEGSDIIYVDSNRTDSYIEDGSFNRPFKDIKDAVNYANDITDETATESTVIKLQPGVYEITEELTCSGNIILIGAGTGIGNSKINLNSNSLNFGMVEDGTLRPWLLNDGISGVRDIDIVDGVVLVARPAYFIGCTMTNCVYLNAGGYSTWKDISFSIDKDAFSGEDMPFGIGIGGGLFSVDNCDINIDGNYSVDSGLGETPAPIVIFPNPFGNDSSSDVVVFKRTSMSFDGQLVGPRITHKYSVFAMIDCMINMDDTTNLSLLEFIGDIQNPTGSTHVGYFNNIEFDNTLSSENTIECGDNLILIRNCDFVVFNGTNINNETSAVYYQFDNSTSGLSAGNIQDAIDELYEEGIFLDSTTNRFDLSNDLNMGNNHLYFGDPDIPGAYNDFYYIDGTQLIIEGDIQLRGSIITRAGEDGVNPQQISTDSLLNSNVMYVDVNYDGTNEHTGSITSPFTSLIEAQVFIIVNKLGIQLEDFEDLLDSTTSVEGAYTLILKDGTYSGSSNQILQIGYDLCIRGEGSNVVLEGYELSFGGYMNGSTYTLYGTDPYITTKLENLTIQNCTLISLSDKMTVKNCRIKNCIVYNFGETFVYDSIFQMDEDGVIYDGGGLPGGIINIDKISFYGCEFYKDGQSSLAMFLQGSVFGDVICTSDTKSRFLNCRYLSSDVDDTLAAFTIAGGSFDAMSSFFSGNFDDALVLIDNEEELSTFDNYIGNNVFINDGAGDGCYIDSGDLNTTYLLSGNVGLKYGDIEGSNIVLQELGSVQGILYSSVADSSVSPASSSETVFDIYHTLPANFATLKNIFKFAASYTVQDDYSSNTLIIRVRIGGLTGPIVMQTTAYNAVAGDTGVLFATAIPHVLGDSGHFHVLYTYSQTKSGVNTMNGGKISVSVNTTIANDLVVTYQWSGSNSDNQVYLDSYLLEVV